jgi:serine/threonine protein kinase
LGEEFARRLRRGELPSVSEYARKYPPGQAEEVAEFLESIALLEGLKQGDNAATEVKGIGAMPEIFGRYRIERTLGEGGMGAVYLAHDSHLNRHVALKIPKFTKNSESVLIDRFYREARSAATLHHPNICPVYDVGEIDGMHFISMAYIEGRPLSHYINARKLPVITAAVRVVRKVAIALHEAHLRGIVHRDLKPGNIMIDRRNEPIVMDFGLAAPIGLDDEQEATSSTNPIPASVDTARIEARLTKAGSLLGSPGYMSPEQFRGWPGRIGPASDVYSLGVLLYELLTGELPFGGNGNLVSLIRAATSDTPPPDASTIRPDLDPQLAAICRKAMAKRVQDRYESMQAFAAALTDFLNSEASAAASTGSPLHAAVSARRRESRDRGAMPRWFYAVASSPIVVIGLLIAAIPLSNMLDDVTSEEYGSEGSIAKSTTDSPQTGEIVGSRESPSTTPSSELDDDRPDSVATTGSDHSAAIDDSDGPKRKPRTAPFGDFPMSPRGRLLQRFDSDHDGKVSKAELSDVRPMPGNVLARRAAEDFDQYDDSPQDGFLDAAELRRIAFENVGPLDDRKPGSGRPLGRRSPKVKPGNR